MGKHIFKGLIKSFLFTIICVIIFSIITFFVPVSEGFRNIFILVITLLSVMYGSIYASKKTGHKGWLVGLILAFIYIIIVYLISGLVGRGLSLQFKDFLRIILALFVGLLSGMLGINI